MTPSPQTQPSRPIAGPPAAVAWAAAAGVSLVWALLRLVVFQTIVFPLTYAIPLLLCVWTRNTVMLWLMAGVFSVLHTIKQFMVLPADALPGWADWATYGATLFNIGVAAAVIHAIILLRGRLEQSLATVEAQAGELAQQNEELTQQSEELAEQNEELSQQAEELSQQAEELSQASEEMTQQAEELSGQNEELQTQSEEIQALNAELGQREGLLQGLLDAVRHADAEMAALQRICRSAVEMLGPPASAVVVYERHGTGLVMRGAAGPSGWQPVAAPAPEAFPWLVMHEDRTASLADVRLRPDLAPVDRGSAPGGGALLGSPLHVEGRAIGALVASSDERHEWTAEQFRILEWISAQTSQVLRIIRLRDSLVRHAELIELTPDAIVVRSWEGTITLWGGGAEALYGWTKDEAIGTPANALLATRFPVPFAEVLDQLERTGRWSGDVVQRTKDGRELAVQSRWLARRDAKGRIAEFLESNVDVTERKRTERVLRDADQHKNEFLATLSHELRNPLAPIRFALQLLDDGDERHARQAKQVIERQLAHLVRLVDDLLDATRIASNKIRLRKQRVDLAQIVEQATETCLPEIEQAHHAFTVSLPPEPVWLDADPDRLAQILINLLTNAARYTPPGGRIRLSCQAEDGHANIAVEDNGIGLQHEDLSRVFGLFAQLGEPGKGGLGIGLSLVKGLVELHGGHVEARSDGPGRGSTFCVRLPRAPAPTTAEGRAPAAAAPSSPRRILVVDDNVDAAEMMKTLLQLDGHHVQVAHDGDAALARLREHPFEIGVFDIGLPGMSGYELAQAARRFPANRDLYLIAVTGWGQEADRERARSSGFHAHVTKPADPELLRSLIARAVPSQPTA